MHRDSYFFARIEPVSLLRRPVKCPVALRRLSQ
jgi:hypothetical protein